MNKSISSKMTSKEERWSRGPEAAVSDDAKIPIDSTLSPDLFETLHKPSVQILRWFAWSLLRGSLEEGMQTLSRALVHNGLSCFSSKAVAWLDWLNVSCLLPLLESIAQRFACSPRGFTVQQARAQLCDPSGSGRRQDDGFFGRNFQNISHLRVSTCSFVRNQKRPMKGCPKEIFSNLRPQLSCAMMLVTLGLYGKLIVEMPSMLNLPIERTTRWKCESDLRRILHYYCTLLSHFDIVLAERRCSSSEDS